MKGDTPGPGAWDPAAGDPWRVARSIDRRGFLRVAAAAGGGLLLCFTPVARWRAEAVGHDPGQERPDEALNAYVRIGLDGTVTIRAPCPEIGQGVRTSLPMIVAGELGASWDRCVFEQASADDAFGSMAVGGSDSVADYFGPLREAGAVARVLLITAAAARLGVPATELTATEGRIVHLPTVAAVPFGELVEDAARLPLPGDAPLREDGDLAPVGRPTGSVDARDIVTGRAVYGIDLRPPGLVVAAVARAPVHGGRVRAFDDAAARAVPGVIDVMELEPRVIGNALYGAVRSGVAVVARDTWTAFRARDLLDVEWDLGEPASASSEDLRARLASALEAPPAEMLRDDGPRGAAGAAGRRVQARFEAPLLAHACMEPVNFTAEVRADRVILQGPTQAPRALRSTVARAFEMDESRVEVHPTLAGGGFGRRLAFDYGVEAAFLARTLGRPVKVVWSREDDLRHDYYRPPSMHALEAVLDEEGIPARWSHHLATGSLLEHISGPGAEPAAVYDVQGGADLPYAIPHIRFGYSPIRVDVQLGSWRSVAHSFNVFAVESFLDEIAEVGGWDPLELRLRLLPGDGPVPLSLPLPGRRGSPAPDHARLRRVLREVASIAEWERTAPDGIGRGLACCWFKHTYVAHVAEVEAGDPPRIRKVWASVDGGRVVNPDGVRAQVEGAAMDAAATVLHWGVRLREGRVTEGNFHEYRLLRIHEAPAVEVSIVGGEDPPSGMGEPPYPSAVAAIAIAVGRASGRKVRALPV